MLANYQKILSDQKLPAVLVDLDRFDQNVRQIADIVRQSPHRHTVRVATKSIRVPELILRIVKSGHPYKGLMCYSCEEAFHLANFSSELDDFLIAYPTLQPSDIELLKELHKRGKLVRLIVDSEQGLDLLAQGMSGVENPFSFVIDVDASLRLLGGLIHIGVRRSPVRSVSDVLKLIEFSKKFSHLKFDGLMMYEAQVAGLVDRNPFKRWFNPIAWIIRKISMLNVSQKRQNLAQALKKRGVNYSIFNGGGSGSFNLALNEAALTEVAVGSGFLDSHLFDYYSNIHFEPALYFGLPVCRKSDPDYVTCFGGGYIASGEPAWSRLPIPVWPEGLKLLPMEGCGEVQTPLRASLAVAKQLKPGDCVLFRPAKAGEISEYFDQYLLVSNNSIISKAKTYRSAFQK